LWQEPILLTKRLFLNSKLADFFPDSEVAGAIYDTFKAKKNDDISRDKAPGLLSFPG
jgi:hypothetical protein